jgi:hypothetical protein
MAETLTPNFFLHKPDPLDIIDVTKLNANMDIVDANLAGAGQYVTKVPASSDFITTPNDPVTGRGYKAGLTIFGLTSAQLAADNGWNLETNVTNAVVVTFKDPNTARGVQFWFQGTNPGTTPNPTGYYRYMASGVNYAWLEFGGVDDFGMNDNTSQNFPQNNWNKNTFSSAAVESKHGLDVAQSGSSALLLKKGGVYYVEGMVLWGGSTSGTGGIRYLGIDVDGAGPGNFNRKSAYVAAGLALQQDISFTRPFSANSIIYLWANQTDSPTQPVAITLKRLYAKRVGD